MASAVENESNLADEKMPDEWLDQVSKTSGLSDKGIAHLAKCLSKKGFVSAKDAIRFVEIEKAESEKIRFASEKKANLSMTGAQRLIARAKDQVEFIPSVNEAALSGIKLAGNLSKDGVNIAMRFLRNGVG